MYYIVIENVEKQIIIVSQMTGLGKNGGARFTDYQR